jgi:PAS domain S-box-containing protein
LEPAFPPVLHQLTKLKTAAVTAAIFVLGLAAGAVNFRLQQRHLAGNLRHDVATASVAFDRVQTRLLAGARADLSSPAYATVKARLQKLKAVDPRVRACYLLRADSVSGKMIFLAHSAATDAPGEARPGDDYPEAARTRGLQEVLRTRQPAIDGPFNESSGTWTIGYAALDGATASPTEPTEILCLDVDATSWARELWLAALRAASYIWILLGLPLFVWLISRRQGEQREVIRNLSEAVEQSHSAILILDLKNRIEYVNRGLCQQMGYTRRELIGRGWWDFHGTETPAGSFAELVAAVHSGRTWEGQWLVARKNGTHFPARGRVTPVKHRDGTLAFFVAIFDDVTAVKEREIELREARDLAEAGDRAKGQFLATMSHEVRTPLNGIVGFTSLLLETELSPEQREYVQTIRASGEALIQLTGDILDFARIESGKLKLDPLACDPRECVEDALDLHAAKAAEKGIELLHHTAMNVPAAVVVDGGRLRQVLVNLVGNAVKFTERGEVAVSLKLVAIEEPATNLATDGSVIEPPASRCVLEFAVADTGIGIAPEQHVRLFKPFSQVDDSSTRRYGGTGLGLAICKNLVHLMDGSISLTSEPGRGSTFTFTVRVPIAVRSPPARDLGGMRIGLVAPPVARRAELGALLTSWHAAVETVAAPAEITDKNPEVVLIDVAEPGAGELAARSEPLPGLPPERTFALVPISLANERRTALRKHFRLLINRPLHHGALFALLSGAAPRAEAVAVTQFGFRVLIVEDNIVNQRLMQRVLTTLGCTFRVAENGRSALAELKEHAADFDLVLLDLHMPEMDGLAALEQIRHGHAGRQAQTIWIVALTADARAEQRDRGLAAGLNDYLTKPVKLTELEAALHRYRADRLSRRC